MTNFDYALKQNDNGTFEVVQAATGESLPGQVETVLTSTPNMATVEVKLRLTGLRMYKPFADGGVVSGVSDGVPRLVGEAGRMITVKSGMADPEVGEEVAASIRHFREYNLR